MRVYDGMALLAINNSRSETSSIQLSAASQRYTLSAVDLQSGQVLLNGDPLELSHLDRKLFQRNAGAPGRSATPVPAS